MCEICKTMGYEIRDGCPVCGCEGDVGVYLDGSGCWECSTAQRDDPDVDAVVTAFGASGTAVVLDD